MAKTKSSGATRLADLAEGRQDVFKLDPATIVVTEGFNYRNFKLPENKAHLKDTKASIRINGVLNPLWVQYDPETGTAVLIAGETRLRSVREILDDPTEEDEVKDRVRTIPVIQKRGTTRELLLMSLQENTQKPPSKWEVGLAFKRLMEDNPDTGETGMTVADIANAMGYSKKYVEEALELEKAEPWVKQALSEQAVTPAHMLGTLRKHGDKAKFIIETEIKAARKKVEEKKAAKAEKAATGKKSPGRKPKEEKVKPVARPKKSTGKYIKDEVIKLIKSALKKAARSEDVDMSTMAESALEALTENLSGD